MFVSLKGIILFGYIISKLWKSIIYNIVTSWCSQVFSHYVLTRSYRTQELPLGDLYAKVRRVQARSLWCPCWSTLAETVDRVDTWHVDLLWGFDIHYIAIASPHPFASPITQNVILFVVSQCSIALSVCQCSSASISVNGCQVKFVSKEGSCKEGKSLTSGRHGSRQAAITWANGPIQSVIQSLKVVHFHCAILMCTTDQHLCSVAFFNYSCTCNAAYCTTLHHILWSSSQHVCSHNLIAYECFLCFAFKHFWEQWKDHWTLIQWVFLVLHHCGPNEWAEYYETILWLFNIHSHGKSQF